MDTKNKKSAKFLTIYEGPYRLKRQIGEGTYVLKDPISNRELGKFHVNMFEIYLS